LRNFYIGIDPGAHGAIAMIDDYLNVPALLDYVSVSSLKDFGLLINSFRGDPNTSSAYAGLENVSAFPNQGVVSMHTFGRMVGEWEAFLVMMGLPYIRVRPKAWQDAILGGISFPPSLTCKNSDDVKSRKVHTDRRKIIKAASLDSARNVFPKAELNLAKHSDRADALNIARYVKRLVHEGKF